MNILDQRFKYTNADNTNIRKTFARIRKQLLLESKKCGQHCSTENHGINQKNLQQSTPIKQSQSE
jgi:hypothetical protein